MRVGYFCTFTPKELIEAAGFSPFRILAKNSITGIANVHIQSYSCSQARGSLERALREELQLDGVIFTRSCDTLMRLADIWERNTKMKVYNFEFPTRVDEKSKDFLISEIRDLATTLKLWGGDITLQSLKENIELYKELEKKLEELFSIKPDYELLLRVQEMSVKEALKMIKVPQKERDRPKILITGSVCPFLNVFKLFEEVGFAIKDDLCIGTRFFSFKYPERDINSIEDGFRYLAEKYLCKAECPTKHYERERRFRRILELSKDCDGVIFLLMKFCDPHFFDYPQLKEKLEEMGKKTMLLEIEFPVFSLEQLRTRIEAFYEVISC